MLWYVVQCDHDRDEDGFGCDRASDRWPTLQGLREYLERQGWFFDPYTGQYLCPWHHPARHIVNTRSL